MDILNDSGNKKLPRQVWHALTGEHTSRQQRSRTEEPIDDNDRRLSQRTALKVVAKKLSGLWKFVVHLKLAER
ncbi:hypothetical protein ABBQ32_012937 [Trebouxia sp. C0010 RCD-2024]